MNLHKYKEQINILDKNRLMIKELQKQAINSTLHQRSDEDNTTITMVSLVDQVMRSNDSRSDYIEVQDNHRVFIPKCIKAQGFLLCRDGKTSDCIFDPCGSLVRAGERYYQQYKRYPLEYLNRIYQEIQRTFNDLSSSIEEYEKLDSEKQRKYRWFNVEMKSLREKVASLSGIKVKDMLEGSLSEKEKEAICDNGEKAFDSIKRFWKVRDVIHAQLEKLGYIKNTSEKFDTRQLDEIYPVVRKMLETDQTYQEYYRWELCMKESKLESFAELRKHQRELLIIECCMDIKELYRPSMISASGYNPMELEEKKQELLKLRIKELSGFWKGFIINILHKEFSLHRGWIMRAALEEESNDEFDVWIKSRRGTEIRKIREKYNNIKGHKGSKIYLRSKGKEFNRKNVNEFFNDFLNGSDEIVEAPVFKEWNILNNHTGLSLANCIVNTLYPYIVKDDKIVTEKIITKKMREEYEKLATGQDYRSNKIRGHYEKRLESKNAWVDRADVFGMLEFVCIYFTEVGQNVSWVIAVDIVNEILNSLVYVVMIKPGKAQEKDIKEIMRSLVSALCEVDVIAYYKDYVIRIKDAGVPEAARNQCIDYLGNMHLTFESMWEKEWERNREASLLNASCESGERSEDNLAFRMIFQWIIQNLK